MKAQLRLFLLTFVAGVVFLFQGDLAKVDAQTSTTTSASKKQAATTAPTAQEIADARSKNMVWVNTSTRVYHNSSSSLYGKTKRGKFMTEDDAKKAGYRAAADQSNNGHKKSSSAASGSK